MASTAQSKVTIEVDRSPVRLDESFNIVIEADGSSSDEPDFTSLRKAFDILGTSRGSRVNIVNGHYSATTRWTLEAMARRAGDIRVPPIRIGNELTPSLTISVVEGADSTGKGATPQVFLEVDAEPRNPYVQAQVLYTVRLYRAVSTRNASLSEPRPVSGQTVVKRLGKDETFDVTRHGQRYRVVERRYALFPQHSGTVTMGPVIFEGEAGGSSRSLFDPFARGSRLIRHRSPSITLRVRAIPAAFTGKTWLPARQLELHEAWSTTPPDFKVGEPITRTLALIADGLTASQLPAVPARVPAGLKPYPDRPELRDDPANTGVIGVRQDRIALIPTRKGDLVLPPVDVVWWNTETDREEHARLPARPIQVAPGTSAPAQPPASQTPAPQVDTSVEVATQGTATAVSDTGATADDRPGKEIIWILSSLLLATGWIITLFLWWRTRRVHRGGPGDEVLSKSPQAARKAVRRACGRDDPRAVRLALLDWARIQWPEDPPANLGQVGERVDPGLREEIDRVNRSLYAPTPAQWAGDTLWTAFQSTHKHLKAGRHTDVVPDLAPLYGNRS